MYNLKKFERYFEEICWDRALVLWKKNLPGCGLTKVEKHWSRVYVIRVHPKAEDGRRHLLRIISKTAQCHRLSKKSKEKIKFPTYLCGFRHLHCLKIVGLLVQVPFLIFVSTIQVIFKKINWKLPASFKILFLLSVPKKKRQTSHQFHHTQ